MKLDRYFDKHTALIQNMKSDTALMDKLAQAIHLISSTLANNNRILFCGNGGSAADSEHLAGELAGRFKLERPALPAEALHVNAASLTAIANDYGYQDVFSRILESKGKQGDILYAMSTSGKSENITAAINKAKTIGLHTILITGNIDSSTLSDVDIHLALPSTDTPRIQEAMMLLGHIICEEVESKLFG